MPTPTTPIRMERHETEWSEPTIGGSYATVRAEYAHAWMCPACRLVWEKRWYATTCAERGHRPSFDQVYGGRVENGRHVGGTTYTRRALRREPAAGASPSAGAGGGR